MINGFEEQTHELTQYELQLVPLFVQSFKTKIGSENAVTSREIVERMKPRFKMSDARVRKIVNHIRTSGLLPNLIATSKGYFITENLEELEQYEMSLAQRAMEILRVKESIAQYRRSRAA